MAKASSKKAKQGSAKTKTDNPKTLTKSALIATASATSFPVDVAIDFTSGLGQATAVLFRNGVLINMQSISVSGSIHFSDVESRDTMSVNGVCAGKAKVTISVPTNPPTPEGFTKVIIGSYIIL